MLRYGEGIDLFGLPFFYIYIFLIYSRRRNYSDRKADISGHNLSPLCAECMPTLILPLVTVSILL